MRGKAMAWAAAGAGLLLAGCAGFVQAGVYEDEFIRANHGGFSFSASGSGLKISGSDVSVTPKEDLCNVKIEAIPDDNGNGQPDDKGVVLSSSTGTFKGWSASSLQFGAAANTTKGFIKISGVKCDTKPAQEYSAVIVITQVSGAQIDADSTTYSVAWFHGPSRQFTEVRRSARGTTLVAGDLRAAPGHLQGAMADDGELRGDDELFGLAVLAGQELVGFYPSQNGLSSLDLPSFGGHRVDLRLVSLDKKGRITSDWQLRRFEL